MSAPDMVTAGRSGVVAGRPSVGGPWTLVPALALVQAIRVVRQPALLLGLLWYLLGVGLSGPETPYDRYAIVTAVPVFLLGVPAYLAVNLVSTSGRRSGVDEWTGGLPMPDLQRTVALMLAAATPAVLAGVGSLGFLALRGGDTGLPLLWQQVAAPPAAILGGGLLGVAVSRLLPRSGLPLVVVVAVVSANVWVSLHRPYLGAYVDFVRGTDGDAIPAREPGSAGWHLVYLLALGGLAAAGALLPVARPRWLPFAAGAVAGAVVLTAGYLQLP